MPRYENGRAPLADLVKLGEEFYLPHGTAARWRELQRLAWEKYGVWLVVTSGWNGYRPLAIQYKYREELGVWAAVPGHSSHGLTFNGWDCAAIDVNNWRALAPDNESLAWARFVALCRLVGFTVDFVTPREPWHIGDFDPFSIPAFAAIAINPGTTAKPAPSEEDDMPINFRNAATGITYTMIPGISISAHINGFGSRLSNYVNTGVWPASESNQDRYNAGLRDLSEDHVTWMLPLYGFGRLSARDLPNAGIVYADRIAAGGAAAHL